MKGETASSIVDALAWLAQEVDEAARARGAQGRVEVRTVRAPVREQIALLVIRFTWPSKVRGGEPHEIEERTTLDHLTESRYGARFELGQLLYGASEKLHRMKGAVGVVRDSEV